MAILKKTVIGISTLALALSAACATTSKLPRSSYTSGYNGSNLLVSEQEKEKALESVEQIVLTQKWAIDNEECKGYPYYLPDEYDEQMFGSAVVVHEDETSCYLLTANHVVDYSPNFILANCGYTVGLPDIEIAGKDLKVEVVYKDMALDFAYIKTEKTDKLHKAKIGNSDKLKQDKFVYAIGYSLALDKYITSGHVTATRSAYYSQPTNSIIYLDDEFTFDAAISPGNSGGPVFAANGAMLEVVGLAVASYHPYGQNLNIAVKINDIIDQIKYYEYWENINYKNAFDDVEDEILNLDWK
ncbi:MAG: S1C family serine protease [Candidatus Woesearchaeota archaeon]